jgi:predicted ester cyclase
MTRESLHKDLMERITEEIWNQADLDRVPLYYTEDFTSDYAPYASPRHGHEGIRAMVSGAHATFSPYREEILDMLAEGDRVMVRLMIGGKQTGPWGPIPPSGKELRYQEVVVMTFRDGRIAHQKGLVDNLHALRQLGVVPTPRD